MKMPKRLLTAGLVTLAVAGMFFSVREARGISAAKKALPPACLMQLAALPEKTAKSRGVALGDCAFAMAPTRGSATVIGHLDDGSAVMEVKRPDAAQGPSLDLLAQISLRDARLYMDEVIAQGQGCNGGIEGARIAQGILSYNISLTPAALLSFAPVQGTGKVIKTGDVANRMQDCFAKVAFTNRLPAVVQFLQGADLPPQEEQEFPKQLCFEGLVAARTKQGRAALNFPEEYVGFVQEYAELCY